jgi:type-F conjugative transfer system pilin assembly thiol-disulfide isomerase TrbB
MRTLFYFLLSVMTVSFSVSASTLEEIAALEANKQRIQRDTVTKEITPISTEYRLSDGRRVNLQDWTAVLFMSSSCAYCQRFDPVLKAVSQEIELSVFPYTLDGKGDASWPQAIPAPPRVITEFFAQGLPIATPTVFLVNVHTMKTYPLLQGEVSRDAVLSRLDEVFLFALDNKEP